MSNYYGVTTVPEIAQRQIVSALEVRAGREIPDTTTEWSEFEPHLVEISKRFPEVVIVVNAHEFGNVWATAHHAGVRVWEWERTDESPPLPPEVRGLAGFGSEKHAGLGQLPVRS